MKSYRFLTVLTSNSKYQTHNSYLNPLSNYLKLHWTQISSKFSLGLKFSSYYLGFVWSKFFSHWPIPNDVDNLHFCDFVRWRHVFHDENIISFPKYTHFTSLSQPNFDGLILLYTTINSWWYCPQNCFFSSGNPFFPLKRLNLFIFWLSVVMKFFLDSRFSWALRILLVIIQIML